MADIQQIPTAIGRREARGKEAYAGRGSESYLPKAVQEALSILSYAKDGDFFDDAYETAKKVKPGLSSKENYRGLLARYYQNVAKEQGWSEEDFMETVGQYDIPSADQMEAYDSSTMDRLTQGIGKIYGQTMFGVGKLAGTADNIQAERKQYVKSVQDKEDFWKSYNAEVDYGEDTEMDLPWNVAGGIGEALPYMAGGALAGLGRATATSQLVAGVGAESAIDIARYQEHGSTEELAMDLATNILPTMGGTKLANVFRDTPSASKIDLPSAGELRDMGTRVQGAKLLKNKDVVVPNKVVADPAAAAKDIQEVTNPQRALDMEASIDDIQGSAKKTYTDALNEISDQTAKLEESVPPEYSGNALGYLLREYTQGESKKFSQAAKPFKDAYEKEGAGIDLDVTELIDSAAYGTKDKSARSKIQNAIKNLKDVQQDADFDINNITANDLDDIIKQLNQDVYDNADSMSGKMTQKTIASLNEWMGKAKDKLNSLPPEFSDNYREAKKLYGKGFDLVQENDIAGKGSPIKGIELALQDKTGKKMQSLFTGSDSFNNLLNLGKMMKSDNPLYGAIMRNFIESKVGPGVMSTTGVADKGMFNLSKYSKDVQDIDWNLFRRSLPNQQGAVDKLEGLEGVNSLLDTKGKAFVGATTGESRNAESSFFKKPGYFMQDIKDMTAEATGIFTPWYRAQKPGIGNKIEVALERTKAPGSRKDIYAGPDSLYNQLSERLEVARENLGLTKDNRFIEVNAPMLNKE